MDHEYKYFLYLYLAEKHTYILAHIIIVFPKGKATHICHKAETLTFLIKTENMCIPAWGSSSVRD